MPRAFLLATLVAAALAGSLPADEGPRVVAEGKWSEPVESRGRSLRGRLVICERTRDEDRREFAVYVELQDVSQAIGGPMYIFCDFGRHDFRPEYKGGLRCELKDKAGQTVKTQSFPFGGAVPLSEWVTLPTDSTIRLRSSPFGIHRPGSMAIAPDISGMWVIAGDDTAEYFLSGSFTAEPAADNAPPAAERIWRGTLVLPAARIANERR